LRAFYSIYIRRIKHAYFLKIQAILSIIHTHKKKKGHVYGNEEKRGPKNINEIRKKKQ